MRHIISKSGFIICMLLSINAWAADDSWTNVFKFQSKMAQSGSVNAQLILGEMYEDGRGVAKNYPMAFEWYNKAQENGHKQAANKIASLKQKIADEKLKKSQPKISKPVKTKKVVKAKPKPKTKTKPKTKLMAKKVEAKKPVAKSAPAKIKVNEYFHKPEDSIASPDDLDRGKGTHLDDSEDPFD